jgi:hypothetical protein
MSPNGNGSLIKPWTGNLYAPTWAGIYPQLPGYCDVDFDYAMGNQGDFFFTVTLGPSGSGTEFALQQPCNIDTDADYLAREMYISPLPGSTPGESGVINAQALKVRIRDGDGNAITSDWVTANDLCGPLGPCALPFRKGGNVTIDLWNQSDGTVIVACGFKGWKRFPCFDTQGALPPVIPQRYRFCKEWPGVRFEEYEYFFEFANGANAFYPPWVSNLQPQSPNQIFQKFALPTDNDADFLWRGITGMILTADGPVAAIPDAWFLLFYGLDQTPLANVVNIPGIVPTPSGPSAEMVISNGGGRMNPHWPEILIPRGMPVQVDILLQTPATGLSSVQFSLRGFKVYKEACGL